MEISVKDFFEPISLDSPPSHRFEQKGVALLL